MFREAQLLPASHTSIRLKSGCVDSVLDPTVRLDGASVKDRSPGIPWKQARVSRNPQGQSFRSPVWWEEAGLLCPRPLTCRTGGGGGQDAHGLPRYKRRSHSVIPVWEASGSSMGAVRTECAGLLDLGGWRPGMLPDSLRRPRHICLVLALGKPLGRQDPCGPHGVPRWLQTPRQ